MAAALISSDVRLAVVAAPAYVAKRGLPQTPQDLTTHDCINLCLPTYGGLLPWEFSKDGQSLEVNVQGQPVFNRIFPILMADTSRIPPVLSEQAPVFACVFFDGRDALLQASSRCLF